jgi:hypothetical protein
MPSDESSRDARGAGGAAFAAAEADEAIRLFCYLRDSEGLDEATARTRAAYIISGVQPLSAPPDSTRADREEAAAPTLVPEAVGERPSAPSYGPAQAPGDEPGEDAQHWHTRDASATPEPGVASSGPTGAETAGQREPPPAADLDPERRVYALYPEPGPSDSERTRYRLYDIGSREPESAEVALADSGIDTGYCYLSQHPDEVDGDIGVQVDQWTQGLFCRPIGIADNGEGFDLVALDAAEAASDSLRRTAPTGEPIAEFLQEPGAEPGPDAQQHSARDAAAFPDAARDTDPWRPAPGQPWQPAARLDPAERRAIEQAALSAGLSAVEASAPVLADLYAENRQFRGLDPEQSAARALHTWSQVQAAGRGPATALPRASDLTHDGLYQTLRQRGDDHGQALTGTRDEHLVSLIEPTDPAAPIPAGEYGHQPPAPPRAADTDPIYPPQPGGFRPRSDGRDELPRPDERVELTPLGNAATTTPAADDTDAFDRPAADTERSTSSDELAAESEAWLHRIDQTLARAREALAESDTELTRHPEAPPEQAVEVRPAAHAEPTVESEEACL